MVGEALGEIRRRCRRRAASNRRDVQAKNAYNDVHHQERGRLIDVPYPWFSGTSPIRGGHALLNRKAGWGASAKRVVDAKGLVVSPGFIDMLEVSEIAPSDR